MLRKLQPTRPFLSRASTIEISSDNVTVILVEPSLPQNVGAVARAMNNLGVNCLQLVNPCEYLSAEARRVAAKSEQILEAAKVFSSLQQAVAEHQLVLGLTARIRERHAEAIRLWDVESVMPASNCRLAVVFGRESSGLTNDELALCNRAVHIPTFGGTSSFNLAQAVVVTLYELSRYFGQPPVSSVAHDQLAKSEQVEGLKQHLFETLQQVGFLRPGQEETMWASFSDLLGRANLTELDVRLIRGFCSRVDLSLRRAKQSPSDSSAE